MNTYLVKTGNIQKIPQSIPLQDDFALIHEVDNFIA